MFDGLYAGLAANETASTESSAFDLKTGRICTALRNVLQQLDQVTYATCLVTSFACQQSPDYEAALGVIKRIKGESHSSDCLKWLRPATVIDKAAGDDTVKFLIYLSDTDKLYDVALGMYDFELVLAVAQQSQKVSTRLAPHRLSS